MRVLLDTSCWLWMVAASTRLGSDARSILWDTRNELLLSAASSWEIAIKYAIGKLPLPEPPERYVPSRMDATGVTPLRVEHSHALAVTRLPRHHRDPFDRLLVAQAGLEGVPVMTSDAAFDDYDIEIVSAVA
ncbi:MAG: type II toxin-antitoxin system VapC family toxin [Streptosporangiaceae bacterium]